MNVGPVDMSSAASHLWRPSSPATALEGSGQGPFAQLLARGLREISSLERNADVAVQDLATGQAENVHDVVVAVAKADLAFRLLLEIRNRVTEAFQEILRMQV